MLLNHCLFLSQRRVSGSIALTKPWMISIKSLPQRLDAQRFFNTKSNDDENNNNNGDDPVTENDISSSANKRKRYGRRKKTSIVTNNTITKDVAPLLRGESLPLLPHVIALPTFRRPIFPGVVLPITIHDSQTSKALYALRESGQPYVGLFLKKNNKINGNDIVENTKMGVENMQDKEESEVITNLNSIYSVGSYARIHLIESGFGPTSQITSNLPTKLILIAQKRIMIDGLHEQGPPMRVKISPMTMPSIEEENELHENKEMIKAYSNEILAVLREIIQLNPLFKEQMQFFSDRIDVNNPYKLADFAASVTTSDGYELQEILEERSCERRLKKALELITKELQLSKVQQTIKEQVEEKVSKHQRRYLLMEQLKTIKKELGIEKDDKEILLTRYKKKLDEIEAAHKMKKMKKHAKDQAQTEEMQPETNDNNATHSNEEESAIPKRAKEVIMEEMEKLETLEKGSSEYNVIRSYLDWLTCLPWGHMTDENLDINIARDILNTDHYGLKDVKQRILEFIAVSKLKNGVHNGKILCLVGPPGVGKTSIGKSISRALNREFYRFSVGGLYDVAEIKGHRRTYVGAMPGKIIQCLKLVKSMNPLILIDEIDKLGSLRGGTNNGGDASSALLELLDPNQNTSFVDHYLDVPVDLSNVLFLCTANILDTIPSPLLDRMEIIRLSGYDGPEKLAIANQYLIPKLKEKSGLGNYKEVDITEDAIDTLIKKYCREAGVRNLEQHIEKILRKIAYEIVEKKGERDDFIVSKDKLQKYVGKYVYLSDRMYDNMFPGVVMGLAWTSMGGSTLYIETKGLSSGSGSGSLQTTGQMGKVMEESTKIAYTYARSFLQEIDPENKYLDTTQIHMHVPEGATPKDGPSAGCTMVTALLSLAKNQKIEENIAMTGELSLIGKVLPVGGIKEKIIAAKRANVKQVILPIANEKDVDELPDYLKQDLLISYADYYEDIYKIVFEQK